MISSFTLENAIQADATDSLAEFRGRFFLPTNDTGDALLYLCGNSLGLQPRAVPDLMAEELEDWARLGVTGHFDARRPWMPYHENLTANMAEIVGAQPDEVVVMNTLTVNLHLMMVSFYRPTEKRFKLLIEKPAFPSDRYAAESQVRYHRYDPADALLEIGPRDGEHTIRDEDLLQLIEREGKSIALVMLPGVQYYSGQLFDIAAVSALARHKGCAVGWDLAHAAGNVPLNLHDADADFAVWCNYKYLNGGPGAIGGCFVHARHAEDSSLPRFCGWWGHEKSSRFRMGPNFHPIPGAEGWQLSNPPILAMTSLIPSLQLFHEAGMTELRAKSRALTGFLELGVRERLGGAVESITPSQPERRGCQLSLRLDGGSGRAVFRHLETDDVVCDWREPDVIRVAPVPLYNSFVDVYRFVEKLHLAMEATA
jgi:kynureninase